MASLKTRSIRDRNDLVAHFDQCAPAYREGHGDACRLLDYRLDLIRQCCGSRLGGVLLEIGCGTAIHLANLADVFSRLIGTDISPGMIRAAQKHVQALPHPVRMELRVDPAEELATIGDDSIDVVLCVGAFEHMPGKAKVVRQVARVLKPGGRFICLTLNRSYCWYSSIAPCLRVATRHLSTDSLLSEDEAVALFQSGGLDVIRCGYWTFIPRGDMPRWAACMLQMLDAIGRLFRIGRWRGGIVVCGVRGFGTAH